MVITVNAWMNNPTGFTLEGGRVSDVRPLDALFGNDYLWHELVHMYVAASSSPASSPPPCTRSHGCVAAAIAINGSRWLFR